MKTDVFEGALRATAKIACISAMASISCRSTSKTDDTASGATFGSSDTAGEDSAGTDTGIASEPGSEQENEPASEPSNEPTTEPAQPASEPAGDTGDESNQECLDTLNATFGGEGSTPESELLACCTDIVQTMDYNQLVNWEHYAMLGVDFGSNLGHSVHAGDHRPHLLCRFHRSCYHNHFV